MNYTEENNIPGLLLLIDFEKAFDSLSWQFIHKALKFLNFGPSLIRWIDVFYKNITSAVSQCGFLSSFFKIGRGCRQGDPLSPYLFIICAEFLSTVIRKNKKIKGIFANGEEFKVTQFADDTTIFLDGSEESLNSTLEELDRFAKISGLKINYDKTQLVWIGSKKHSQDSIKTKWKLLWGEYKFRIVGINFNVDLEEMVAENYEVKLQELEKVAKQWEKRSLSPLGKVTIIKTFMISAFNHLFTMLPNPNKSITENMIKIIYSFLWNKKPSKLKQTTVIKQYEEGGLKMVNLIAFMESVKLTWIRRLLVEDCKWQVFIKQYIQVEKLTGCSAKYLEKVLLQLPNHFWRDVIQSFISINKNITNTEDNILKSSIFYNNNIKIGGSHIFLKSWFDRGIKDINDLIDENGKFYQLNEFKMKTGIQTNFLEYNGLIKSIRHYLQSIHIKITHRESTPFIPANILPILKNNKGSKCMYDTLNKTQDTPTGQASWNKIYNLDKDQWKKIYTFPFNVTSYTALLWFQICINHNILVTNKLLYQMKINENGLCSFCQTNNETIIHLFWQCNKTQQFITNVKEWLMKYNIQCDINEKYFLLGLQEEHRYTKVTNFILLYAKYYIYLARCKKQNLNMNVFQNKLKVMYKVHKEIAFSHQEDENFNKDWNPFLLLINDIV